MEIKQIPLSLVIPSPMNPRKTFDEVELQELADNIEKQGLLQPITVRPIKHPSNEYGDRPDKYEIVCGERRYRAMCRLSDKWAIMDEVAPKGETYNRFSKIASIIREMTDEEAFDAMITENLQRKDVDAMEEAFAFSQLMQKGKTAEEIALRFGRSVRFVQDRVKLNNIIPELMLAVREDKMGIGAAMLIAKLDEEQQQKYYKQNLNTYYGFTKSSAQSFVSCLFTNINHSMWYESDKDFAGGCGRKCSECQKNTSNHGCLFWEMKSEDDGRCTSRSDFEAKTQAYMFSKIDAMADKIVKADQPLEFGKTVLCIKDSDVSGSAEAQRFVAAIKKMAAERGYEVIDPSKVFKSKCYYNRDDERTVKMRENGELYSCLRLFQWSSPELEQEYWYVNANDTGTNVGSDGTPYQVTQILTRLKGEKEMLQSSMEVAGAEALAKCAPRDELALLEDERTLMLTYMLLYEYSVQKKIGMDIVSDHNKVRDYVTQHPELSSKIIRAWLFSRMNRENSCLHVAKDVLDDFGKMNCPEEYQKAKDKVKALYDKNVAKYQKQLKQLGYDLDGKPLAKADTVKEAVVKKPEDAYAELKKKHPDAILLFRVGDFYECFHDDAGIVAKVLGLTKTKRGDGVELAGFPHHALDKYLPMLIRAKHRVAIVEKLDEPQKVTEHGKD